MKNIHKIYFMIFAIVLMSPILCPASSVADKNILLENNGIGIIDWGEGSITVIGQGSCPTAESGFERRKTIAKQNALSDAYGKLKDAVMNLRLDSNTIVKDKIDAASFPSISSLEGLSVEELRFFANGNVTAYVSLNFFGIGSVFDILYSKLIQQNSLQSHLDEEIPKNLPVPAGTYSGLIISAGKSKIIPSLNPKILSIDGKEIYGISKSDEDSAVENGIVVFSARMRDAKMSKDRIGIRPLIIKSVKSADSGSNIIISKKDAEKISKAVKKYDFFKRCRVIFVI